VIRPLALAALLAAACAPTRRPPPIAEPGASPERPLSATERRGQIVFMRHCHSCHPGGEAGLGPALDAKPLPQGLVRLQIRNGFGAMPPFGDDRIAEDELDALVQYVTALRRR
jgi:mono/diheme cytochrome c family protein